MTGESGYLYFIIGTFTIIWFYPSQVTRYLLPVLPVLNFLLDRYVVQLVPSERRPLNLAVCVAVSALMVLPGWAYACLAITANGSLPVTEAVRHDYLARKHAVYEMVHWLNQNVADYSAYQQYAKNMAQPPGETSR